MVGFVLSPLLNSLLNAGGLPYAMVIIALIAAVMIPIAFIVTSRDPKASEKIHKKKIYIREVSLAKPVKTGCTVS